MMYCMYFTLALPTIHLDIDLVKGSFRSTYVKEITRYCEYPDDTFPSSSFKIFKDADVSRFIGVDTHVSAITGNQNRSLARYYERLMSKPCLNRDLITLQYKPSKSLTHHFKYIELT
jgi:hypothetical protein